MKKNSFSTHFLDRASSERINIHWIDTQLKNKSTAIIPVCEAKVLCRVEHNQQPVFLSYRDFDEHATDKAAFIFLGLVKGKAFFAYNIATEDETTWLCQKNSSEFIDFRKVAPLLSYNNCALLALARFMVNWHSRNTFCGQCGHKTNPLEGGNARSCTNESCKQNYYPSMDPAVIVLVTSGEKCLLGRQSIWPNGMYSTIAGFVEPGESIEDAVHREVEEETGIRIDNIKYQSSQPWLFPSSLMLGFNAEAKNRKIVLNKDELEDARWFTRVEIRENIERGIMKLPMKVSIAYNLIKIWYNEGNLGNINALR